MNKSEKCKQSQQGRIVINNGVETKRIYPNELENYLSNGWVYGFLKSHNENLSRSSKGRVPSNKGKSLSEETRIKISNSLKGNISWNKGLNISDERVRKNTSSASKTKIEKYGNAFGNNNMTEEHKRKIGDANRGKSHKLSKDKLKIKLSKQYLTRKKNNSFNTSKPEEDLYTFLLEENKNKTIYRNYKDKERYPFYCDFYIVEDDLFIELNAHWTHGDKPYNPEDIECQEKLKIWQEKAKTSKFYQNAIQTWTVRDVKKLECAKEHNLNYKVIYSKNIYD